MSTVVFLSLPEPGHLNPTFKLGKSLKERGHKVYYMSASDFEQEIRQQGLECIPFFQNLPRGYFTSLLLKGGRDISFINRETVKRFFDYQINLISSQDEEIKRIIWKYNPDVFVIDSLLPVMSLVAHRNGIPSIFLNFSFGAFEDFGGIGALKGALRIPEIILCPQELELPLYEQGRRRRFYVEPSIDLQREEVDFPWERLDGEKPLLYCSLGTQSHFYKQESLNLIESLIEAMRNRPEWQAVISVGQHTKAARFEPVPPNVVVVEKAPQIEILRKARMMITHGGLGSIKECIYFGVPMIVYALGRDQPRNAVRVVYHRLGVRGNIKNVSRESIEQLIEKLERDPEIKQRVEKMGERFREAERQSKGVRIIEKLSSALKEKNKDSMEILLTISECGQPNL